MMNIVTAKGHRRSIDPAHITFIRGPKKADQGKGAAMYMSTSAGKHFKLNSHADVFFQTLQNKSEFVRGSFARAGGHFWVKFSAIKSVRAVMDDDLVLAPTAQSVMVIGKHTFYLTEDLPTVQAAMTAAGAQA